MMARPFLDFVHPDDRADTAAQMGRIASGPAAIDYENRFRGKDGADRRLQWNAVFSPERQAICASARDVAGQKGLEGALIEASDREKGRMGRELHDGLCQNLAGIAALSATLARKLAGRGDPFKERMEIVARQYGPDIELYGYCRDILDDDDMPPLNKPEGVKWLEKECRTIQPEVIVFDSIMCLLTGNMAEEESWAPIMPMLRQISQQRCAQIWLHHTGPDSSKGFGTTTREWQMDTVLSLTKDAQNNEHLLMEFKKARLRTPDTRAQFEPLKITCGADRWETVGGVDKRRGAPGDRGAAKARAFLEAYDRLAFDAPSCTGFNSQPVKKVALDAIRREMRSRGALGDSTPGVLMTSGDTRRLIGPRKQTPKAKS
jgi:Histidine kinase